VTVLTPQFQQQISNQDEVTVRPQEATYNFTLQFLNMEATQTSETH